MTLKTKEERAEYARRWRAANPEKVKAAEAKKRANAIPGAATARMQRWRAANPERAKEQATRCNKAWRLKNLDKRREYEKEHRLKNIERYREYNARWHRENRANNPAAVRAMHLKSAYGITPEEYEALLTAQGGGCKVCAAPPEGEKHKCLHVDHDHTTGAVRGLLCHRCNTALGLLQEDKERMLALAAYLPPPES
jgi:hypothetical protein